jgi:hypothetical protein
VSHAAAIIDLAEINWADLFLQCRRRQEKPLGPDELTLNVSCPRHGLRAGRLRWALRALTPFASVSLFTRFPKSNYNQT